MKSTIIVQNLKCGGCAKTITGNISKVEGISAVFVDPDTSSVSFEHEKEELLETVHHRLKDLGYPSVDHDNTFIDKTRSFVSCATGKLKK